MNIKLRIKESDTCNFSGGTWTENSVLFHIFYSPINPIFSVPVVCMKYKIMHTKI